ncbi:trigger factor [uncultured Ruminococcus sp.]|uniref:trigger factor n=1 Tax=uncultured Ruminococcus sp. TaxID=165186 RepID=UPI002632E1F5|nr:trigger factor [uncultured Ruminococcus sp.]
MNLKSSAKTDVNMTELVVEIDAESFENAVEAAYQRQKKNISMPGFRKGKVPRKMCERTYGENVFYEDAINALLNVELPALIVDAELEIVDTPKVEVTSISKEEGVSLKVICVTKPEINLVDYKGIEAPKVVKEVTDEDVDQQIEAMRQRNARVVSVDDRAAEMGDEVNFNFEGFFGDEAFEGGKGENYQLKLGSGQFIPGFEEQVAGHNIGEDFDVTVTFPENYQMEDYAGKEAVFKCSINSISREELPELDDEFVKDTSEFDTVDELKADVRKKLEESAENAADNAFENAVIMKLIEKVEDPIPHCMFEHRADALMNQFANQLKAQGVSLDLYLQYTGMDQDSLKATYLDRAENEVKLRLALEKIAALEKLEVSDEDLEAEVVRLAEENGLTPEDVKKRIYVEELRGDMLATKAMDLVKEAAVPTDAPEETEEAPAEEAVSAE